MLRVIVPFTGGQYIAGGRKQTTHHLRYLPIEVSLREHDKADHTLCFVGTYWSHYLPIILEEFKLCHLMVGHGALLEEDLKSKLSHERLVWVAMDASLPKEKIDRRRLKIIDCLEFECLVEIMFGSLFFWDEKCDSSHVSLESLWCRAQGTFGQL